MPIPHAGNGALAGVFAVSRTDAWAVGSVFGANQPLLYQWDGSAWHRRTAPRGMTAADSLITGDPAGRLWVTGAANSLGDKATYFRFSGGRWHSVAGAASPGQTNVQATSLAAVPGTAATWSAGIGRLATGDYRARIELDGSL